MRHQELLQQLEREGLTLDNVRNLASIASNWFREDPSLISAAIHSVITDLAMAWDDTQAIPAHLHDPFQRLVPLLHETLSILTAPDSSGFPAEAVELAGKLLQLYGECIQQATQGGTDENKPS